MFPNPTAQTITQQDERHYGHYETNGDDLNARYRAEAAYARAAGQTPPQYPEDRSFEKLPRRRGIVYRTLDCTYAPERNFFPMSNAKEIFSLGKIVRDPGRTSVTGDPMKAIEDSGEYGGDVSIAIKTNNAQQFGHIIQRVFSQDANEIKRVMGEDADTDIDPDEIDPTESVLPRMTQLTNTHVETHALIPGQRLHELDPNERLVVFQRTNTSTPIREEEVDQHWLSWARSTETELTGGDFRRPSDANTPPFPEENPGIRMRVGAGKADLHFSDLVQVGPQLGSNAGGRSIGPDGDYYHKHQPTNEHARNSVTAARLYELAAVKTVEHKLVDEGADRLGIATKWENLRPIDPMSSKDKKAIQANFAAHAWLANHDAIGENYDNQAKNEQGEAVTIDTGGALFFRAQGQKKGNAFDTAVQEWSGFLSSEVNPQAANIFGDMSESEKKSSAIKVTNISNQQIKQVIDNNGPGDQTDRDLLTRIMIERKERIKLLANFSTNS